MKKFFTVFVFLSVITVVLQGATIIENGKSDWNIYLWNKALPAERTAAEELARYLKKSTGADLEVTTIPRASKQIIVGHSPLADEKFPEVKDCKWKDDEIFIASSGDNMILTGARPRGSLYAVFEFLERQGFRFWAPKEEFVPSLEKLETQEGTYRFAPPVLIRYISGADVIDNPAFAVKKKQVVMRPSPEHWGGSRVIIGPWHTFDRFYPADKFFKDHPEHFSLIKGKRIGGQNVGQLCLSNKEMRKAYLREVLAQLRKETNPEFINVSQNDNWTRCECESCVALEKKTGGASGILIDFVNEIAAGIENEFPNVIVQTFAYQYTRTPPDKIVPRKNVSILFCTIERDMSRPLTNTERKENVDLLKDLRNWQKISRHVDIWDYIVSYSSLFTPLPNLDAGTADIKLFAEGKPILLMMQGDMFNHNLPGDLQVLKINVWSRLMWNPELDPAELERDFVEGYYGSAAPAVKEYLSFRRKIAKEIDSYTDCWASASPWLKNDDIITGMKILKKAMAQAKTAEEKERIDTLAKPFEFVLLSRGATFREHYGYSNEELQALARNWLAFADRKPVTHWLEEWTPAEETAFVAIKAILKLKAEGKGFSMKKPEFLKKLDRQKKKYLILEEDSFQIGGGEKFGKIVSDPLASNGIALELFHPEYAWTPKIYFRPPMVYGKKYDCYFAVRLSKEATGAFWEFSHWTGREVVHSKHFGSEYKIPVNRYIYIPAGRITVGNSGYMFFAGKKNPEVKSTLLDHLLMVEAE